MILLTDPRRDYAQSYRWERRPPLGLGATQRTGQARRIRLIAHNLQNLGEQLARNKAFDEGRRDTVLRLVPRKLPSLPSPLSPSSMLILANPAADAHVAYLPSLPSPPSLPIRTNPAADLHVAYLPSLPSLPIRTNPAADLHVAYLPSLPSPPSLPIRTNPAADLHVAYRRVRNLAGLGECPANAPYINAQGMCTPTAPAVEAPAPVTSYTLPQLTLTNPQSLITTPGALAASLAAAQELARAAEALGAAKGVPIVCTTYQNSSPYSASSYGTNCTVNGQPGNDAGLILAPGGLQIAIVGAAAASGHPMMSQPVLTPVAAPVSSPPAASSFLPAAAAGNVQAIAIVRTAGVRMNSDQWNWYRNQGGGGATTVDLFPAGNRDYQMSIDEYFAARARVGSGVISPQPAPAPVAAPAAAVASIPSGPSAPAMAPAPSPATAPPWVQDPLAAPVGSEPTPPAAAVAGIPLWAIAAVGVGGFLLLRGGR